MISITYTSSARGMFSESDLKTLLAKSQAKNAKHAITGLLLYRDGNFLQTICVKPEGLPI